jgi:hypothetical protein
MAEHTGGDWWILDNGSEEESMVVARRHDPFRDVAYLKREPDQDFAEVEANAALIVAAPELLAALEAILAYEDIRTPDDVGRVGGAAAAKEIGHAALRLARTAVAKAKGADRG